MEHIVIQQAHSPSINDLEKVDTKLVQKKLEEISNLVKMSQTKSEDYSDAALGHLIFQGHVKNDTNVDQDFASGGKLTSGIKTP